MTHRGGVAAPHKSPGQARKSQALKQPGRKKYRLFHNGSFKAQVQQKRPSVELQNTESQRSFNSFLGLGSRFMMGTNEAFVFVGESRVELQKLSFLLRKV